MTTNQDWDALAPEVRRAALEALEAALDSVISFDTEKASASDGATGALGTQAHEATVELGIKNCEAAAGGAITRFGAEAAPAGTWGERELRTVPLGGGKTLHIAHDGWGAPVAVEGDDMLVSLADERGLEVCAWADPSEGSRVVGLGIDLVCIDDLAGVRGRQLAPLLLSEHEISLAQKLYGGHPELGYALAFSAKEAAFKACAAPLRVWRGTEGGEPVYEVRDFELARRNDGRRPLFLSVCVLPAKPRAQTALKSMGIQEIRVTHARAANVLVTIALALNATKIEDERSALADC